MHEGQFVPPEAAGEITKFGILNKENAGEQRVNVDAKMVEKKLVQVRQQMAEQNINSAEMIKVLLGELERAKENLVLVGDAVSGEHEKTTIPRFVEKSAKEVGNQGRYIKTDVKNPGLFGKMLGKKGEVTETRSVRNDDWANARTAQRSLKEEVLLLEKVIDEIKKLI